METNADGTYFQEGDHVRLKRTQEPGTLREAPLPTWGANLSRIDFDTIYYYIKPVAQQGKTWDDIPADIKDQEDGRLTNCLERSDAS
jgi:Fe-S cluster assembly protein SufB